MSRARASEVDPPSKVAATVTRQPFVLGTLTVAFARGASGPAWLIVFSSDVTVMLLAGVSDPFTIVTAAIGRGCGGVALRSATGGFFGASVTANGAPGAVSTGVGSNT